MSTFKASPCTAVIDLSAILHNYRKCAALGRLMPVIKSDAYGHGMLAVADVLHTAGAQDFAVGTVSEATALRDAGFTQFICCLLGAHSITDMAQAYAQNITPLITNFDTLAMAANLGTAQKPFSIGIKCNTGMTRLGFELEDLPALLDFLHTHPNLLPVLALSHFACADMPDELAYTQQQATTFATMTDILHNHYPQLRRSLANSAAMLTHPEYRYELCRPGIVLYGGNPFYGTTQAALGEGFQWAMSVKTPVLQVRDIRKGTSVSYGRLFTAQQPTKIAVLGVGYADGFTRCTSNLSNVLINNTLVPQVGRVCMGMLMVDVSTLPNVHTGDIAWIMGGPHSKDYSGPQSLNPQDWANMQGSIPYETLCLFGHNTREYV